MTDAELFGLTDDEKRREHIQRSPEIEAVEAYVAGEFKKGVAKWEDEAYDENGFYDPKKWQSETITSVAAMQLRAASLFSEMIQGKITGYRVEMDRSVHPATFHITIW